MARGAKTRVGIILHSNMPYSFAPDENKPDELMEGVKCLWVDDDDMQNLLSHNAYGPPGREKLGLPAQEITLDKASFYKMQTVPGVYRFKMGWKEVKTVRENNGVKKETVVPYEVPVEIAEYVGELKVKVEQPKPEKN